MGLKETAFLREQLARVERFTSADGWKLQRVVEETAERNCKDVPVDVFFAATDEYGNEPNRLGERTKIAEHCHGCPVADECLVGALERGERFGGWGGVAQPDFQELSRLWRRKGAAELAPGREAA